MKSNYIVSSPWWRLILECPGLKMNSLPMASLVAQMVKNLRAMQETQVPSLGQENPLENGMATHSSVLSWRIP